MSRSGQKIVGLIQDIATRIARQHAPQLFFGEVLEVEPLKIKVDDRYEITEEFILLDSRCKETWIKIPEDGNPEHTHTMEEFLVDVTATGNLGAPIIFVPLGIDAMVPNPSFDPNEQESATNPKKIVNPDIPNPTTLSLKHRHSINNALEKILLWRGLEEGDKVKILRVSTSIHYILERVEGITNDPK